MPLGKSPKEAIPYIFRLLLHVYKHEIKMYAKHFGFLLYLAYMFEIYQKNRNLSRFGL